jgi:hypothetical protein
MCGWRSVGFQPLEFFRTGWVRGGWTQIISSRICTDLHTDFHRMLDRPIACLEPPTRMPDHFFGAARGRSGVAVCESFDRSAPARMLFHARPEQTVSPPARALDRGNTCAKRPKMQGSPRTETFGPRYDIQLPCKSVRKSVQIGDETISRNPDALSDFVKNVRYDHETNGHAAPAILAPCGLKHGNLVTGADMQTPNPNRYGFVPRKCRMCQVN